MRSSNMMKALTILSVALVSQAAFAVTYDANVTPDVIFGSGNLNGSFAVDTQNGVELGLRAKLRHDATGQPQNVFNSNGDGTYSFAAGVAPTQSSPTAVWSFEWSINSDVNGTLSRNLDGLTYELGIDTDPSLATVYGVLEGGLTNPFDPVNTTYADHAIGTNATGNGGGSVAIDASDYSNLINSNNVAQNSWKPHWFITGFDPTVDGQYDFYLAAFDGGVEIARTEMSVIVGAGAVPVPAAVWLFGSALGLVGFLRRKVA